MVTDIDAVVYEVFPLSNNVPADAAEYQSMVSPAPGVAVIVTVPVPHLLLLPAAGDAGNGLMVAVTAVLVAAKQPVVVFLACA